MNPRIILTDFKASLRTWSRSKGTVFWTILFPVLLIFIFGAIFTGMDDATYTMTILDNDDTFWSQTYIDILKNIPNLKVVVIDENISDIQNYMKKNDINGLLVIENGFGDTVQKSYVDENVSKNVSLYYDPSDTTTAAYYQTIVRSSIQEFNLVIQEDPHVIGVDSFSTLEDYGFMDYFVPGIIGMSIMQLCVYGSIERNTKYRKDGILRKLLTTPITRSEWILAKMLFMLFLSFISATVIITVGVLVWGMNITINLHMIVIIIANSFLFSGLGMIIGRFVKDAETADMAGGAITFPMMFLAGTFWPLDSLDPIMQNIAHIFPLYYVNEGLRNSMIYLNFDKATFNLVIVLIFALVFFIAGVILTKWKED